ncbi:DUF3551 domain-containing protein [Bradyrhizobium sp.]|uniref:DUF3551 domain-containing protein n=1 Tax=Bradyrhizobium sp. TaxID=376 RepID=UPI004037DF93
MKSRHTLAAAALTFIGTISAAPTQAQTYDPRYPVCLQVYKGFMDYYYECAYTSIPQCQMSASGRAASCLVNPYYAGPKGKRSKQRPPGY